MFPALEQWVEGGGGGGHTFTRDEQDWFAEVANPSGPETAKIDRATDKSETGKLTQAECGKRCNQGTMDRRVKRSTIGGL